MVPFITGAIVAGANIVHSMLHSTWIVPYTHLSNKPSQCNNYMIIAVVKSVKFVISLTLWTFGAKKTKKQAKCLFDQIFQWPVMPICVFFWPKNRDHLKEILWPTYCSTELTRIDLMHMTSQKGAPACRGSNEALSRAPSPSMQPTGQHLHAIPPGRPGPAHWLRGWERQHSSSTTRARSATSLDPQHGVVVMETWRQCIRSILC